MNIYGYDVHEYDDYDFSFMELHNFSEGAFPLQALIEQVSPMAHTLPKNPI